MTGVPIRISQSLYNDARKESKKQFRSIQKQVEWWALIGKMSLESPRMGINSIKEMVIKKYGVE